MSSPAPAQIRSRISRSSRSLAGAAVGRARLSVVPRRRSRAPRVPFVTLVSLLLLSGVVGLLLFNTSMQQASFATTALEEQSTNLAAREQSLKMELEGMRDPQHLAVRATKLGMVQSCAPLFVYLGTGEVKGQRPEECVQVGIRPEVPGRPAPLDPAPIVVTVPNPNPNSNANSNANSSANSNASTNQSDDTTLSAGSEGSAAGTTGQSQQSQQSQRPRR